MNNLNHSIEKNDFEAFIHAIGFEIEHAQVKLIVAANTQMLFHYWKLGHFIRYYQTKLGWGGKVINKISQTIKMNYPEKKGYSARNLTYMCQFARLYPLKVLQNMLSADVELEHPTIATVLSVTKQMDNLQITQELPAQFAAEGNQSGRFTQEAPAQIPSEGNQSGEFTQEAPAQIPSNGNQPGKFTQELPAQIQEIDKTISLLLQAPIEEIEKIFIYSPISNINWASHLMLLDSSLSLGVSYWYMK